MSQSIVVAMVNSGGERFVAHLPTEEDVIGLLKAIWTTATPISLRHQDGSALRQEMMERIHRKVSTHLTERTGPLRNA